MKLCKFLEIINMKLLPRESLVSYLKPNWVGYLLVTLMNNNVLNLLKDLRTILKPPQNSMINPSSA